MTYGDQGLNGTNQMLESLIADARTCGLRQSAAEHLGEIEGQFNNDPVADYGKPAVDQVRELIEMILSALPE
ncbi:hypothetical protein [Gordonia sihwensis]|uniref:hypothetical protein n=1 Tax=Gordonia sihwensis TaxID=173559 RepID=UPI003D953891